MQEDRSMEVPEYFPLLAEEVERNRQDGTDEETPQETVVDGISAKHLPSSEGTPKDGGGKESVDIWAGEVVLLASGANIRDLLHLVVEDARTDEGRNEGSEHLGVEGDPGWYMNVMSEFEILGEVEGV